MSFSFAAASLDAFPAQIAPRFRSPDVRARGRENGRQCAAALGERTPDSVQRHRDGRISRRTYLRDCTSNAGIALVAASFGLLRLGSLVTPATATIIWLASVASFCAGVACVATGFGLLVRENRQRA